MYDNYIALDWAQRNMAIARMTKKSEKIQVKDVPSSLGDLKDYLRSLRGSIILTFEETTTAHWLFTELKPLVDRILVCDPYKNTKSLSIGAKTDINDAKKLVKLLRAGMLEEVFHTSEATFDLRVLVSSYQDLVQRGVRLKNQKSALFRAEGLATDSGELKSAQGRFSLKLINKAIEAYEEEKNLYEEQMKLQEKKIKMIKRLKQINGIGLIGANKIAAIVITVNRFASINNFLSYAGLVRLEKLSGGRSYGSKKPRHQRMLKSVFKTAALSAIQGENEYQNYYKYLITKKNYPTHNARHAVARKIATAVFGVMKTDTKYEAKKIGALRNLKVS